MYPATLRIILSTPGSLRGNHGNFYFQNSFADVVLVRTQVALLANNMPVLTVLREL